MKIVFINVSNVLPSNGYRCFCYLTDYKHVKGLFKVYTFWHNIKNKEFYLTLFTSRAMIFSPVWLFVWGFTPLSTIFQLYRSGQLPNAFPGFPTSTHQLLASSRQLSHWKQRWVTKIATRSRTCRGSDPRLSAHKPGGSTDWANRASLRFLYEI